MHKASLNKPSKAQPATASFSPPPHFTLVRWWQAIIMLRRYQLQLHGASCHMYDCFPPIYFLLLVCVKARGKQEQMFPMDPCISSQLKIWRLITTSFI